MRTVYRSCLLIAVAYIAPAICGCTFALQHTFIGQNFFDEWDFETFDDPTHGRTNYVDKETALKANLSFATDCKFFMQPDSTTVVQPGARGRDSIRIMSKAAYADSVVILDVQHMPFGCATWPAFWSKSAGGNWPIGGEIDVIEGYNLIDRNLASLHTTPNCSMPARRHETGQESIILAIDFHTYTVISLRVVVSTDCDTSVNYNQGCGTNFSSPASYGEKFNEVGGGYYALVRTKEAGIRIWFWPREHHSVPLDVKGHFPVVNPDLWGTPGVYFPTNPGQCDYDDHFDAHNLVFDLTFCGDLAGTLWGISGCGSTACTDYVDNNPEAFKDAYWEVNSLKVFIPSTW